MPFFPIQGRLVLAAFALMTQLPLRAQQTPPPAPAQTPAPAQAPASAPAAEQKFFRDPPFMRRIFGGVSLSVLPLTSIPNGGVQQSFTTPRIYEIQAGTTADTKRVGGGVLVGLRLPGKFAAVATGVIRPTTHMTSKNTLDGTDLVSTPQDDRRLTTEDETTKARYWDFSVLLRRYSKDHEETGPRWFFEGGGAARHVTNIATTRIVTVGTADPTTNGTPHAVAHKWARGVVGGVGAHFKDDIGISVIPEFRYTRWLQRSFDLLSARSRRDQFEAVVSFTF